MTIVFYPARVRKKLKANSGAIITPITKNHQKPTSPRPASLQRLHSTNAQTVITASASASVRSTKVVAKSGRLSGRQCRFVWLCWSCFSGGLNPPGRPGFAHSLFRSAMFPI
jgi:hypothetical protein